MMTSHSLVGLAKADGAYCKGTPPEGEKAAERSPAARSEYPCPSVTVRVRPCSAYSSSLRSERRTRKKQRIAKKNSALQGAAPPMMPRTAEHTSELQSQSKLVCRPL